MSKHSDAAQKRLIDAAFSVTSPHLAGVVGDLALADSLEEAIGLTLSLLIEMEGRDALLKAEQDARAAERRDLAESRERLKDTLIQIAEDTGATLESAHFTASVGRARRAVVVTDLDALPERFRRVKIEAEKTAIGKALEAGEVVAGCTLGNGTASLTIRSKRVTV